MSEVGRRDFISLLGGVLAAPAVARAEQTKGPVRIGVLPFGSQSNAYDMSLVEALRHGLRQVVLIENREVVLDVHWITGEPDQAVAEVIQRGADMLIPCGTSASLAAKRQTSTIPIVFISVGNPIGIGLVDSLSHPGRNATGFSDILADLGGKQVDLASELQRGRGPVDYFWHTGWADGKNRLQVAEDAARSVGLVFRLWGIADVAGLNEVVAGAKTSGAVALIVQPSPFTYQHREKIVDATNKQGLATIFAFPAAAREGALVAYGPDYVHMYRRAPFYVERILKGTKPADLLVEQPTKLELVVNLKTAKALGFEMPISLLVRADELVE
jgi:putative tryptophan/tyrosine transport system substrate-binding protein